MVHFRWLFAQKSGIINESNKFLYSIKKNSFASIKDINKNDYDKILEISNDLDTLKNCFYSSNTKIIYCKNAESENNINFIYDINKYFDDKNTKVALDYFLENPQKLAEELKLNSDNSLESEKKLSNIKMKIKKNSIKRLNEIFSELDIYANPVIDIDGTNIKINVDTKKQYKINDNISTQNNSSGYRSIMWLLLNLEYIVNNSNKENSTWFYLLDEPDKNLHPLLQQQFMNYVIKNIDGKNIKMVLSTHSPFMLNEKMKIYYVNRDDEGYTNVNVKSKKFCESYIKKISDFLHESSIFKFSHNKNVVFIEDNNLSSDNKKDIEQYIKSCNEKLGIVFINSSNEGVLIETLESLEKNIIKEEPDAAKRFIIPKDLVKEIIKSNEIKNN